MNMVALQGNRINILGVNVSVTNLVHTVNNIDKWINTKSCTYICITPAHSIMHGYRDVQYCNILNHSGLTTPDGMSIVWLLRLHGYRNVDRVYGPDLMHAVCRQSLQTGWKHYFYGGAMGVAEQLSEKIKMQYPGLQITGISSPPFRQLTQAEDDEIITNINHAHPDIVWVGLGSPKQEYWMYDHLGKLNAPVLIGVGAAFDFLSGNKRQAPRWIQRSGFEWLFRLVNEPQRLWRRYADYPLFIFLILLQLLHLKKFNNT